MEDKSFFDVFTGGLDITYFLAYVLWGYIGMGLNWFIELIRRKPKSQTSPKKFRGAYYLDDNKKRIIIASILVPIAVIMFNELFGMEVTNERALMLGFGADTLAELIKRRSFVSPNKNRYEN